MRKLLVGTGIALAALIVVGVFLPSRTEVSREAVIDAPPATVFVLLNDLDRARDWVPWIEEGAEGADVVVDAPSRGAGAGMRWDSERSGTGTRTIVESTEYERVVADVVAGDSKSRSNFRISADGERSRVRWTWSADFGLDLTARYAGLFAESSTGDAMDRGLEDLAALAESLPRADWSEIPIEEQVVEPQDVALLTASSLPSASAISETMGKAYFSILAFMDRQGLTEAGPPLSISRRFSGSELVFDAAIPVSGVTEATPRAENGIRLGTTHGGPVVRGRHTGSYATLRDTHEKIAAYLAVHGIKRSGDAWEVYVSDPTRTPEAELVTDVYYPIAPDPKR